MKNSGLSVPAASLNNGFSTTRPTTAITAMATAASTRAMTTPWATEVVSAALPSAPIRNSSGTTARSWASRMAKLLRPVVDIMRRWPDSTSMTRAVEESARQAPMISGRGRRLAEPQGAEADHHRREQGLQPAQPEHQAAHGEQAPHRQFQADEEQQEDDAQVGDEGDLLLAGDGEPVDGPRIVGQAAQAMRPQRGADGEETQDGADFQAVDHRGHDGRGAQDDQGVLEDEDLAASRHCRQHRL